MTERPPSLRDDGVCAQCGSTVIKSGTSINGKEGLRGSNRIPIDSKISAVLDNYICTACGYVESYISNREMLNRIKFLWQKVTPKEDIP